MGRHKKIPTRGGRLLSAWLDSKELTYDAFASQVGCVKSYVGLLINGQATPGLSVAIKIETATDLFVPCRAWGDVI